MRDLEVAAGSGSTSSLASVDKAGLMLHQSNGLTSSPWDLTDTANKVVVYRYNTVMRGEQSGLHPIYFYRLPESNTQSHVEIIMNLATLDSEEKLWFQIYH